VSEESPVLIIDKEAGIVVTSEGGNPVKGIDPGLFLLHQALLTLLPGPLKVRSYQSDQLLHLGFAFFQRRQLMKKEASVLVLNIELHQIERVLD